MSTLQKCVCIFLYLQCNKGLEETHNYGGILSLRFQAAEINSAVQKLYVYIYIYYFLKSFNCYMGELHLWDLKEQEGLKSFFGGWGGGNAGLKL